LIFARWGSGLVSFVPLVIGSAANPEEYMKRKSMAPIVHDASFLVLTFQSMLLSLPPLSPPYKGGGIIKALNVYCELLMVLG